MSTAEPSTVPKRRAADAGLLTGRSDEEEEGSDDPYSSGDDIIAAYRARPMASPPSTTTASTDVAQTTSPELDLLAHTAFAQAAWAPDTLGMKAKVAGEGERIEDMQLRTAGNFGFEFDDEDMAVAEACVYGPMAEYVGALQAQQPTDRPPWNQLGCCSGQNCLLELWTDSTTDVWRTRQECVDLRELIKTGGPQAEETAIAPGNTSGIAFFGTLHAGAAEQKQDGSKGQPGRSKGRKRVKAETRMSGDPNKDLRETRAKDF